MRLPTAGSAPAEQTAATDRWAGDHFQRRKDSAFLREFLCSRVAERKNRRSGRSYVLNIDASFGRGKSYFMERFKGDIQEHHSVVLINAWEDDHADDPLVAIMAAIETELAPKNQKVAATLASVRTASGKLAVTFAKHTVITAARRLIGQDGINAISGALSNDDAAQIEEVSEKSVDDVVAEHADAAFKKFEITQATIKEFKLKLRTLVADDGVQRPLFILIDELDRCRPSYAIALLERVKHLFDIEDIVFVIATDTSQLHHAVSAVYGAGFNGSGYLLRFFDRTYRFAEPDTRKHIASYFAAFEIDPQILSSPTIKNDHVEYFAAMGRAFDLTPREIERCFDILRSAITLWPYKQNNLPLELAYLLPLIIAYCRSDQTLFDNLVKKAPQVFAERLRDSPVVLPMTKYAANDPHQIMITEPTLALMRQAKRPLYEAINTNRPSGIDGWVYDHLYEEVHKLPNTSSARMSVLGEYPELVRSVGLLTNK